MSSATGITEAEVSELLREAGAADPELKEIFAEEAEDHLRMIYDGLDRLRVASTDAEALGDVRRAAHTLKGAAGAVGDKIVTRLAHRMEDLLDFLADTGRGANDDMTMSMLSTADRITELVGDGPADVDAVAKDIAALMATLGEFVGDADDAAPADEPESHSSPSSQTSHDRAEPAAAPEDDGNPGKNEKNGADVTRAAETEPAAARQPEENLRVPLRRLDDMTRLVGEMIVNRSAFAQRLTDFADQIDDLQVALGRLRGATRDVETFTDSSASLRDASDHHAAERRATIDELDELEFDRYSEIHLTSRTLSEATGDIASIASECRLLSGDFDALLGRWQRLTREAQDRLMHIRMVPVRWIVQRLARAVRGAATACDKDVELVVRGDHVELDKTVLEQIADPLLHLVRNAVDHGIESADTRAAAGKSARATLRITAANQGTRMMIRVEDDGGGLNFDAIKRRGIERGLIAADDQVDEAALKALIFAPGFSTKDTVTDVSGRGVGMDVVRETIRRLKGTIDVDSTPGGGTRFTITLPTTLSVIRALFVSAGGRMWAVPMSSVTRIARLDRSSVCTIGDDVLVDDGDGNTVRVVGLSGHLGLGGSSTPDIDSVVSKPSLEIASGDASAAVIVDDIHGGHDIVIKSLGDHLRDVPGLIGATVRGDGSVVPILDPADLVGGPTFDHDESPIDASAGITPASRRHVLVVDDSPSIRRVTAAVMKNAGWVVDTAKDGVDAIEQLDAGLSPSIVLTDMEMPRMDGLELLRRLRSRDDTADTPTVMITSRSGAKHRQMGKEAGADRYLVKPFNESELTSLAEELVG